MANNTDRWEIYNCGCRGNSWAIKLNNRDVSPKYSSKQEAEQQLQHYKTLRQQGKI